MKSWNKPTDEKVKEAIAKLTKPRYYQHFFSKLENPLWVEPLKRHGFFSDPPKILKDEETGGFQFPVWPESSYLRKVAKYPESLSTVPDILISLSSTENVSVLEDIIGAAISLPDDAAASIAKKIAKWLDQQTRPTWISAKLLVELVIKLSKGPKKEVAILLGRSFLRVLSIPRRPDEKYQHREARGLLERYYYEESVDELVKSLPDLLGFGAFELFSKLLESAVAESASRKQLESKEDVSVIWRTGIEDHPQNTRNDVRDILVSALRDVSETLIRDGKASILDIIKYLDEKKWTIFKRLGWYLLWKFSGKAPQIVESRVTDKSNFEEINVRHEYARLLNEVFPALTPESRDTIFKWIDEGPDLEEYKRTRSDEEFSHEKFNSYREYWQLKRLSFVKRHLQGDWKKRFDSLIAKHGEPEHPDLLATRGGIWHGPTSPATKEIFQGYSIPEFLKFLTDWTPTGRPMTPSKEGLGRVLSEVVAENPGLYAENAESLIELDPTYLRHILDGWIKSQKKSTGFAWVPVLNLCEWMAKQKAETVPAETDDDDADPHWGWARKEIARLLAVGFDEGSSELSYENREQIWRILDHVIEDSNPTPEHEEKYGGSNMDPHTLSINTVRGQGMHTMVEYAQWISRCLKRDGKEKPDFEQMPEVRAALDTHLDVLQEPSLAIRSIYGRWYPWLLLLDAKWATLNSEKIFGSGKTPSSHEVAAWDCYLTYCSPYDQPFSVLRKRYENAVLGLSENKNAETRKSSDPETRLVEHIIIFYARGKIEHSDPILKSLFEHADAELRGHVINFIGRTISKKEGDDEPIEPEIIQRIKALWSSRLVAAEAVSGKSFESELEGFGWWVTSGRFDDTWLLENLDRTMKISSKIDRAEDVAEYLANNTDKAPLTAVRVLNAIIKGDRKGWSIYSLQESATKILQVGLKSDATTVALARETINLLGERGRLEFGSLLQ